MLQDKTLALERRLAEKDKECQQLKAETSRNADAGKQSAYELRKDLQDCIAKLEATADERKLQNEDGQGSHLSGTISTRWLGAEQTAHGLESWSRCGRAGQARAGGGGGEGNHPMRQAASAGADRGTRDGQPARLERSRRRGAPRLHWTSQVGVHPAGELPAPAHRASSGCGGVGN